MPILFSAVAHEKSILAKFASCDGNFREIAEEMISKIPQSNDKMTFTHGPYLFHYIADDDHIYFCITAKGCQRSRAFLFLNEMKRRFTPSDKDFVSVLAEEMYRYSEDYNTITIRKGELDELNNIGVGSSETILGEKILFVNNPETLTFSTISCVTETPQQISVSTIDSTVNENHPESLTFTTISSVSESPQQVSVLTNDSRNTLLDNENFTISAVASVHTTPQEASKNTKFRSIIIISVIFVLLWLAITIFGSVTFVMLAFVLVYSVIRSSKTENKSE